jgi:hypothetical protein
VSVEEDAMGKISRRLALMAAIALACVLGAGAARAQLDLKAAADTVLAQLEAFRRDDYDTAYTFASAGVRQVFDRTRFEQMVKTGYPEIARSKSAAVERAALAPDGQAYLILKILGANGSRIEAIYEMVWEESRWKIGGVVSRQDNDVV